jgi:hypothetical protein
MEPPTGKSESIKKVSGALGSAMYSEPVTIAGNKRDSFSREHHFETWCRVIEMAGKMAKDNTKQKKSQKLPPPGGFERKWDEPEGRCPYCSFQPTSDSDFCDEHKPRYRK